MSADAPTSRRQMLTAEAASQVQGGQSGYDPPDDGVEPLGTTRRFRTMTVLGLFAGGLLLLQLAWVVAFPPYWGIDETDHVFRASSVAAGHWQPSMTPVERTLARGQVLDVRTDVVDSASAVCLGHPYSLPGNCRALGPEHNGTVPIASAAGRYNPLYYVVAGTAAKPFHGNNALYAMRVTTVLWSCLLLTGALFALMTWARSRWPMVGLLLACTPTVLYSTAVAAPNGVHIAAAICLWCTMTALLRRPVSGGKPHQFVLGALAAGSTVTTLFTHTLGMIWVPMILAGAWGLAGRPSLRSLRRRGGVLWVGFAGAAYLAAAAWVLFARTNDPTTQPALTHFPSPWWYIGRGLVLWPMQAIAAFPDKEDGAPTLVYGIWLVGVGICMFAALHRLRSRTHRSEAVTLALIVLMSFALPTILTLVTVHRIGGAWQGRYGYPLGVGFILGLAMMIDQVPEIRLGTERVLLLAVPALFVVATTVSQVHVLRSATKIPGMVRVSSWDVPPLATLVVCGIASAALLAAALRRQPRGRA